MGAIKDRLDITIQDVKQWLQIPLYYRRMIVEILEDPPVDTDFTVLLELGENKYEYTVDSGATPTPESIVALLVTAMTVGGGALPNPPWSVVDLGEGQYSVAIDSTSDDFYGWVSRGQRPDPIPEVVQDQILDALLSAALDIADEYCNNSFSVMSTEDEVVELLPIPDAVRTGVLQIVSWLWNQQQAGGSVVGPVKRRKAGKTEIEYATVSDTTVAGGTSNDLPMLVKKILAIYRLTPGA